MFHFAEALLKQKSIAIVGASETGAGRISRGEHAAMASSSGGAKGLFLDYASEAGLTLASFSEAVSDKLRGLIDQGLAAENPLGTGASVTSRPKQFAEINGWPKATACAMSVSAPCGADEE